MTIQQAKQVKTAYLAFLGDAVFSSMVRKYLIINFACSIGQLNIIANNLVSANTQSKTALIIKPYLTNDELQAYTRGRNLVNKNTSKNASLIEYKNATALECVFGYLYCLNDEVRLEELFNICLKCNSELLQNSSNFIVDK